MANQGLLNLLVNLLAGTNRPILSDVPLGNLSSPNLSGNFTVKGVQTMPVQRFRVNRVLPNTSCSTFQQRTTFGQSKWVTPFSASTQSQSFSSSATNHLSSNEPRPRSPGTPSYQSLHGPQQHAAYCHSKGGTSFSSSTSHQRVNSSSSSPASLSGSNLSSPSTLVHQPSSVDC
ncbi:hypothetical protein MJO28_007946 [Puccinia striiformis f. sp. tritici]|uniref:Uncharacterized protein n=4 Tax=Puccinia striiformis TaxID=27350 RepID=A0A0L0V022_9BASI|nr:hypothetical protein MJO28_007946 [Puccinia striiformis f. sp. tritici]KAI9602328.1 hypothetical protein H4Q26_001616 [Puccinia striiformis f. sp. tritici PST-130]KNE92637.1 hypothetical protein PSTG_13962 [Puccinia striiformis f. sp. tritici PST-78]POW22924.1 hypothetical protein PSHT_00704 [Puccinia striiformis]KAI7952254.1 hypothetical protein MJO29_007885 [Puccinia striiformis f. sp. tritici]